MYCEQTICLDFTSELLQNTENYGLVKSFKNHISCNFDIFILTL